jgi:hypothetical protein
MYNDLFEEFLVSGATLWVYQDKQLIFSSMKDRLLPLLEYIEQFPDLQQIVIFDKIMGNAAALLSIKAHCQEVHSPLGSMLAVRTLDRYRIKYYFVETVPCILKNDRLDMCPMEKISMKTGPEEFYQLMAKKLEI